MSIPISLRANLYRSGANGVPTADLEVELLRRADSYEHTIVDAGGFESCTIAMTMSVSEALRAMSTWLGMGLVVSGPEGRTVWEGRLTTIRAVAGDEERTRSLDGLGNRVVCKYTTTNGSPARTTAITDTTSRTTWGYADSIVSLPETTAAGAGNAAAVALATRKQPRARGRSGASTSTPPPAGVSVTLQFKGWFYELDRVTTSVTTTASALVITQLATLLNAFPNAFLSADQSQIGGTSVNNASDTQYIAPDTTYRKVIDDLLSQGNGSSGGAVAWGVYEQRRFEMTTCALNTPSAITYQRSLGESRLRNPNGAVVTWWNVRPNAMYTVNDFLSIVASPIGEVDTVATSYISRVTCRVDDRAISVALEDAAHDPIDYLLAKRGA